MPSTLIAQILSRNSSKNKNEVRPGDVVDLFVETRIARDFGGANVVKNLRDAGLSIADPARTFFTFDCNPGGSDQGYAANQHICRQFASEHGIHVYDIDRGIGTHVALEEGLVWPGATLVSTDSHANIVGAIGAFGQGMGDADIAGAFAHGRTWFRVPESVRIVVEGDLPEGTSAKDLTLHIVGRLGAEGLLNLAAEFVGPAVEGLDLAGRVSLASMATEMGAILGLIPPDEAVIRYCRARARRPFQPVFPDPGATYRWERAIPVADLAPQVSRPGRPDDVVPVETLSPTRIDSAFIGSCTNGRHEDLLAAARILEGRKVAGGVVLKIVPASDHIWKRCLEDGLIGIFKSAGALVGNAGCGGCAAGQIGQNGPGEVTVSTGNRNFPGKQGRGEVYLASPETVAASAVAGMIVTARQLDRLPDRPRPTRPVLRSGPGLPGVEGVAPGATPREPPGAPAESFTGQAWVVDVDNIDTDMIYHNRFLAETDPALMGRHTFTNLRGWEDFASRVRRGDIVVAGSNFGCGSSRQQAVTCFRSLGVAAVLARSFGAIYERNGINEAYPLVTCSWKTGQVQDGDEITVDLATGRIENRTRGEVLDLRPLPEVQLAIYRRGGLLKG